MSASLSVLPAGPLSSPARRRLLAAAAHLPLLAACGGGSAIGDLPPAEPTFAADGLDGHVVRRLRPTTHGLAAATDDGLWLRGAAGWSDAGLRGDTVLDVADLGDRLLASVHATAVVPRVIRLVESVDRGRTWQAVAHDFGGAAAPEGIHALAWQPAGGRLYATGADALAVSTDRGRHWTLLTGQWQGFAQPKDALAIDPASGDVWFGGQDAIEGMVLVRHTTRKPEPDAYPGLLPNPSVTKGIRFLSAPAPRLMVSGEGGIVQSIDDGASWSVALHDDYRFFFDVLQDPQRPRRLVTASWEKNFDTPQPLLVDLSDDGGKTWQRIRHPDPRLFGGPWSMAVAVERGLSVFRFGLYRGGVVSLRLPD